MSQLLARVLKHLAVLVSYCLLRLKGLSPIQKLGYAPICNISLAKAFISVILEKDLVKSGGILLWEILCMLPFYLTNDTVKAVVVFIGVVSTCYLNTDLEKDYINWFTLASSSAIFGWLNEWGFGFPVKFTIHAASAISAIVVYYLKFEYKRPDDWCHLLGLLGSAGAALMYENVTFVLITFAYFTFFHWLYWVNVRMEASNQ